MGRGAVWPGVRTALLWLWPVLMVAGLPIGVFYRPSVGVGAVFFGIAASWLTWVYDNRWQRLQHEVFRKREVSGWRRAWARRLNRWAGVLDPGSRLRSADSSFTIEKGIGIVWTTGKLTGCPTWYFERDYVLAHEHAQDPM